MAGTRSPNYPALGLRDAVGLVEKLYKSERRSAMDPGVIAHAMGYNALHGPARSRISALRKYGLIEPTAGGFRLTDAAMTILFPPTDAEREAALRAAAQKPELFRTMAQEPGASNGNLLGRLVRMGFTDAGAKQAIAAFRDTTSLVSPEDGAYDLAESEDQMLETPTPPKDTFEPRYKGFVGDSTRHQRADVMFIWPLPDGVVVQLEVKGGPLTARGVEMLTKYLDLAKQTMAAAPSSSPTAPQPLSERSPADTQG